MRMATQLRRDASPIRRLMTRAARAAGVETIGFLLAIMTASWFGVGPVAANGPVQFTSSLVAAVSSPTGTASLPTASFKLAPAYGGLPLKVDFDASASKAVSGRTIASYSWDFGDGTPKKSGVKTSNSFTIAKLRTVKLTVTDSKSGTASVTHTVDVGNTAPSPTISAPSSSLLFSTGTQLTLTGSATDAQDGALSSSSLAWDVVYNHAGAVTTLLHAGKGNNLLITVPHPVDVGSAAGSTITISLTATDSRGIQKTVARTIKPKLVTLNIVTDPPGANVRVGEVALIGPGSVQTWANSPLRLEAIGGISSTGQSLNFSSWSDGGAATRTITMTLSNSTLTASFTTTNASPFAPIADTFVREQDPNANFGTSTMLEVRSYGPKEKVFLRFNVAGVSGTVTSAKLYLYALTSSTNTPTVSRTGDNWSETGLSWVNSPAAIGSALPGANGVTANSWVIFDVAGAVSANGTVSFVLQRDSKTTARFVSREGGANAPRLIVASSTDGSSSTIGAPQALEGVAYSSSAIDLTWAAPNPASDVTGYDIERDGALVTTTGPILTYRDVFLLASKTYRYRLRTRTANGVSAWSDGLAVLPPAPTTSQVLAPKSAVTVSENGTFFAPAM